MPIVNLEPKYDSSGNMILHSLDFLDSNKNGSDSLKIDDSYFSGTTENVLEKSDMGDFGESGDIVENGDFGDISELFFKGSEINKVDLDEMKKIIAEFRRYADVDIKKLRPYQSKRLNKMAYYVSLLYNHKESYMLMVSEIKKVFSNLTEVAPGTVGAYFYGCFLRTDFEEKCSLVCANSISPLARDSECRQRVVWAKYDSTNDRYIFDETNKNNTIKGNNGNNGNNGNKGDENKEDEITYLYIENPKGFSGFTMSEKESLSKMNIEYVRLLGIFKSSTTENLEENEYDNYEFKGRINDKYEYHDLARRKIKRDKLKTRYSSNDDNDSRRKGQEKGKGREIKNGRRSVNDRSQDNDDEEDDNNSVVIIGFSFFIILLVIFIVMFLKYKK